MKIFKTYLLLALLVVASVAQGRVFNSTEDIQITPAGGSNLQLGGDVVFIDGGKFVTSGTSNAAIPCPVMTEVQRDLLTPANGDCVFNDTSKALNVHDGTSWAEVGGGGGVTAIADGGTGLGLGGTTNGQLLIGNGTDFSLSEVSGTANQVIVTNSAGGITFSAPQDLAVTSSPSFTTVIASDTDVGAVFFGGPQKEIDSDDGNFYWNDTTKSLGIGTSPSANAILELSSTTQAFLPPRMTTAQKVAITPQSGMVLYDTDLDEIQYYSSTSSSWTAPVGSGGGGSPQVCVVSHTRNAAVNSGSCSSGTYTTPLMNAAESSCATMGITVAASQITIATAGNYLVDCTATSYNSGGLRSAWYDVTGAAYLNYGSWGFSSGTANGATSRLLHRFTQAASNIYEMRSYCDTSAGANDFGTWGADGITPSRFSQCVITKVQ